MGVADGTGTRNRGWALPLLVLVAGTFLSALGTSIINVAIPAMQRDFGGGMDAVRWVSTAYLLTLGVATTTSSWLSDRFGAARVFLACMVLFTIASALCGLAWSLPVLIAFRALQAIPGGIIPVVAMTLLYRLVPPDKVGTAMGLYGLGVILAPALGPAVGGWLVEYANWHLVFFVKVPVGLVGIIAALVIFPRVAPATWPKFDFLGFITIALGLVSLMLAADRGPEWGWTGYRVLMLVVFGVLCLALFVVIELEVDKPLIDIRVVKTWVYTNSLVLISISSLGLFALLYYVPLFLQTNQGYQALDAGLLLMPSALTMALMAPIAGRIFDRFGARWPVAIGMAIATYGSILLAGITPDVPRTELILWTTIRNVGVGLSMMPVMASGISALPGALVNSGSTLSNVMLRVASSLGVAVFGGLQTAQQAQLMADRGAFLTNSPTALSVLHDAAHKGAGGLAPLYQQLMQSVSSTTYANAFYLVGLLTGVGAVLALLLRSGRPRPAAAPPKIATEDATLAVRESSDGQRNGKGARTTSEAPLGRGRRDERQAASELNRRLRASLLHLRHMTAKRVALGPLGERLPPLE